MAGYTRSRVSGSNWKHDKRSRHARGYGTAWDKLRKQAMDRDTWLCQPCTRKGKLTPAKECDHITPKHKGGKDKLTNLQAICTDCHKGKTAQEAAEAQGKRLRPHLPYDSNGYPVW